MTLCRWVQPPSIYLQRHHDRMLISTAAKDAAGVNTKLRLPHHSDLVQALIANQTHSPEQSIICQINMNAHPMKAQKTAKQQRSRCSATRHGGSGWRHLPAWWLQP